MPTLIGPSHQLFFGSLHRRRLWLEHLSRAFDEYATTGWTEARHRLESSFSRSLKRLSHDGHLGIQHPLPLQRAIDDTPIDSFLATLAEELDAFEHNLFDLILAHAPKLDWRTDLEEVSMLWGRELAHETEPSADSRLSKYSSRPRSALAFV